MLLVISNSLLNNARLRKGPMLYKTTIMCYAIIQCKYNFILRAGQLGALVEYTSRLEGNKLVSNRTYLICTSNKYYCKYNCVVVVLSSKPIS